MKWTIAGAGALLSVAGIYALITGASIIQVERGWATFIAGAVLLGAGVIVLGIAALMGRVDRLTAQMAAVYAPSDAAAAWRQAEAAPAPEPVRHEAPAPPPPRELIVEPMPTRGDLSPPETSAFAPPASRAPEPEERPAPLRDFKFVFPPAEPEPEPVAQAAVSEPASAATKPARSGLTWLRRKSAPAVPTADPSAEPVEDTHAAVQDEQAPQQEESPEQVEAAHLQTAPAAEPDAAHEAPAEVAVADPLEPAPDPFSPDWLERALAGSDEPPLASERATPKALRRAASIEDSSPAETMAEDAEPVASEPPVEPPPASSSPPPVEIGRYRANDVAYIMYSDGSISAETPAGATYTFNSLIELRAFIERGSA